MLHTVEHPLIADELTRLRDPACPSPEFRQRVRRIASLMVPAVTANFETTVVPCNTPLEITSGVKLTRGVILVPILRAGLGFLDGFLDLIPHASVAHIGLARNETTLEAESYYLKHPPTLGEQEVIILDPMLATGGSAIEAVRRLRDAGASKNCARQISPTCAQIGNMGGEFIRQGRGQQHRRAVWSISRKDTGRGDKPTFNL